MTAAAVDWRWGEVDARTEGGDLCLTHRRDGARLWVREGRLVRGVGYGAARPAARRHLARVGAIMRLRQHGRYLVHASGAVDPAGRAWLFSGDSGSGKSTLAYALARRGWRTLGDDGVLVEVSGTAVVALPWREPLMVSGALTGSFPEIAGGAEADPADPRRRAPVTVPAASRAPVAAVVFVHRATARSMRRLAAVEALSGLVRQSPWVILRDAHSPGHLAALRSLAACPAFELGHTPAELHGIAALLEVALG